MKRTLFVIAYLISCIASVCIGWMFVGPWAILIALALVAATFAVSSCVVAAEADRIEEKLWEDYLNGRNK